MQNLPIEMVEVACPVPTPSWKVGVVEAAPILELADKMPVITVLPAAKVLEKVAALATVNKPELSTCNQVAVEEPITKAFSPAVLLTDRVANGVVVPTPTLPPVVAK